MGQPGLHGEFQDSQSYIMRPCFRKERGGEGIEGAGGRGRRKRRKQASKK